jgi:nucleotide-binding universal stress UspA family protein
MIKTVLVPATGTNTDAATFAAALAVARRFAAHLDFLHVRVDAAAVAIGMASDGSGAAMTGSLVQHLDEDADRREAQARQIFEQFCAREGLAMVDTPPGPSGPSAQWTRQIGAESYWIAEHGRAADLMVIGRLLEGDGVASETIEAALLESGRPILIPTATPMTEVPETIVIAWKATREAAHAVTAASPFVAMAKRILILTVAEEEDLSSEEGSQLMANLRWRGIEVSANRLQPDGRSPADAMLAAAAEHQALLVMGGYGHSRLRQWMFGGFTRHVLETAAAVPVLIAH